MRNGGSLLVGLAAGAIGGFAGALAMEAIELLMSKLSPSAAEWMQMENDQTHHPQTGKRRQEEKHNPARRTSTAKAADVLAENTLGRRLQMPEKAVASEVLHYATGIAPGALLGVVDQVCGGPSVKRGLIFGVAVWAVLNETLIPLMGLSKEPTAYPLKSHVLGLITHLVYGATTEAVSSGIISAAG